MAEAGLLGDSGRRGVARDDRGLDAVQPGVLEGEGERQADGARSRGRGRRGRVDPVAERRVLPRRRADVASAMRPTRRSPLAGRGWRTRRRSPAAHGLRVELELERAGRRGEEARRRAPGPRPMWPRLACRRRAGASRRRADVGRIAVGAWSRRDGGGRSPHARRGTSGPLRTAGSTRPLRRQRAHAGASALARRVGTTAVGLGPQGSKTRWLAQVDDGLAQRRQRSAGRRARRRSRTARPPSSSAKITSSGLIRSAWPKTCGATTWPSICWRRDEQQRDPQRR